MLQTQLLRAVFICCGMGIHLHAFTQTSAAQERDAIGRNEQELLRRQQQEKQQRQKLERPKDIRSPQIQESQPAALPVETSCFTIEKIELKDAVGASVPNFEWLAAELNEPEGPVVIGQCIGALGVRWIIERGHQKLVNKGFVTTRILATQQDMSQGTLMLTLIAGRIRDIRLSEPIEPRANLTNALPMQAGDIFNLRDVEQALENLKRVPTAEADIQIAPASGVGAELGESDLVVSYRQSFPLRLSMSADDSGTKAIGRYQGSVTVSYDNPLALNDLFYVTNTNSLGGGDSGPRGTHGNTIHYSLPFGYWSLGATGSTSRYYQSVAGFNQSYVYRGTSENNEVKLNRLLMRDGSQKLNLSMRAFQRKSNNYIDDTEVGVQRRVVGGWDSTLNHKAFLQDATLETNLTYKRGTGAFGSLPAPEESFNDGTTRFALVTADVNLALPFKLNEQRVRYNASWRTQKNQTPLTPQDRFVIGGRYTVRGYDGESVLSAERGWFWRNDLSFALGQSGQEFYFGFDHGVVGGPSSELLVGKRLTGAVIGLRGSIQKMTYEIFIGGPVEKPDNYKTSGSTAGFSLSMNF
jgi:hemolysin activation/secretion protein